MPSDPEKIDEWVAEKTKHEIYDEPLASDGDFFEYWHTPAKQLRLNLVSQIYQSGLILKTPAEIKAFSEEIDELAHYWRSKISSENLERLSKRMAHVLDAIELARENNGWIII